MNSSEAPSAAQHAPAAWLAAYSLWHREMVRFFRQRGRVAGAVGTPLVFWVVLGAGFGRSFQPSGTHADTTYLQFLFPGMVVLTVLFTAVFSTISVIEDRREGFLQGVLVAPVSRAAVVMGKMLGGTTLALMQGALLLPAAWVAGIPLCASALPAALGILFLVAFALTGLGLVIAWAMDSSAGFHAIMNLLLMPMWLLSGAVFPYADAHPVVGAVMRVNPLSYGVALLRRTLQPGCSGEGGPFPPGVCLAVTVAFAALTMLATVTVANRRSETGR